MEKTESYHRRYVTCFVNCKSKEICVLLRPIHSFKVICTFFGGFYLDEVTARDMFCYDAMRGLSTSTLHQVLRLGRFWSWLCLRPKEFRFLMKIEVLVSTSGSRILESRYRSKLFKRTCM